MSEVNLWVRANMEQYSSETEVLLPIGMHEEYIRIMKQLAHAKAIANLALEQMYIAEQQRSEFFTYVQEHPNGR